LNNKLQIKKCENWLNKILSACVIIELWFEYICSMLGCHPTFSPARTRTTTTTCRPWKRRRRSRRKSEEKCNRSCRTGSTWPTSLKEAKFSSKLQNMLLKINWWFSSQLVYNSRKCKCRRIYWQHVDKSLLFTAV